MCPASRLKDSGNDALPEMKNDRLLRALCHQPVDKTPVWIMRQAGRYLPEYRKLRAEAGDFLSLCKTPELAVAATLQPLARFPLDAAILFSDILTIPDAMGLGLSMVEDVGPRFARVIRNKKDVQSLSVPDPRSELGYVMDAVALARHELKGKVPLIGFAGSPWTLAVYMVEGGGSRDFHHAKGLMYREPQTMHALLEKLATAVGLYLNAQIEAGAQAIMLFDTWGGILSQPAWTDFSLEYIRRVFALTHREFSGKRIPSIIFSKGTGLWMEQLAGCGCDAIGLDWTLDIGVVRRELKDKVALQGNMDPSLLYAESATIRSEVARILESYGPGNGHIFNLGHGIHQYISPERVAIMVDAVHELSAQYH